MNIPEIIFGVFGGLAIFLYGLYVLSGSFKKIAGSKLKKFLLIVTKSSLKSAGFGALVTSIIQSSSITIVTLIGLINAGVLNLKNAVSIMLGAEIGTTVTAQLVSIKIGIYFLPIITFGFILFFFFKNAVLKNLGQVLLGFGILFLGMNIMSQGVSPLKESVFFMELLGHFGQTIIWGILAGALFTAVIQSSSGTIGLIIAMAVAGTINLSAALALMIGANIGTCVTGLIASIGSNLSAKRLAVSQLLINIIGAIVIFFLFPFFAKIAALTSDEIPRQIANAHSIFNITMTLAMLPLIGGFVWLVMRLVPGKITKVDSGTKFIDDKLLAIPSLALSQAQREVSRMSDIIKLLLEDSQKVFFRYDKKLLSTIYEREKAVDELYYLITNYLTKISSREISEKDSVALAILTHSLVDLERIADHAHNIAELVELMKNKNIKYSPLIKKKINFMFKKAIDSYSHCILALNKGCKLNAYKTLKLENEVNYLHRKLEKERLKDSAEANLVYIEIINNLERISDHSENIASSIIMGF